MDQGKVIQLASQEEILEHPKQNLLERLVQRKRFSSITALNVFILLIGCFFNQ